MERFKKENKVNSFDNLLEALEYLYPESKLESPLLKETLSRDILLIDFDGILLKKI